MAFDLGLRIRGLRENKHWSQRQLAEKLGVSASSVSGYENNTITPSATVISDMACIFRVSANYLLGIEEYGVIHIGELTDQQQQLLESLANAFKNK